jgi:D-beta-D-heptose 7-phosphate kinase/D-beta-D-heptose 1-phosphate adenosyltransferase
MAKKLPDKVFKNVKRERIQRLVQKVRRRGHKIVFTNGVFDILHAGHIDYLKKAARMGDFLIVGINTDASVRKFKPDRPIQSENDRAVILAAIEYVDFVIFFKEETPAKLIDIVRPDILVKGADYKISEIVGADLVKSYGGEVKRITLLKGKSTTAIIDRIKKWC